VEPVEAACPFGAVRDEARFFEETKMTRDGRAADRQLVGELLHRPVPDAQELDDRSPVGVSEGLEGVSCHRKGCDPQIVTKALR